MHTPIARALTALLLATPIIAQETGSCSAGPGAAFGVIGYQCANCGYRRQTGQRPSFTFMAEPLILEVGDGSSLRAGDVIEAVNGNPITASAGSEQFTYPAIGDNSITVRRGRDHQTIHVTLVDQQWREACIRYTRVGMGMGEGVGTGVAAGVGRGTATGAGSGTGSGDRLRIRRVPSWLGPKLVVDGVVTEGDAPISTYGSVGSYRSYGFAIGCEPSCTPATDVDGVLIYTYYKYDSAPPVVGIRPGSAAERAGLKVGDLLAKIDGRSIVEPEGALALARLDKKESVRLTIRREGKEIDYVLNKAR